MNSIVKNSDEQKYVDSGYRTVFDGKSEWSYCNHTATKVIVFGIDNS